MFFCKERKRTRERFVLLQKNAEHSILFSIDIYIYTGIYIYRFLYKYILKKERNILFLTSLKCWDSFSLGYFPDH